MPFVVRPYRRIPVILPAIYEHRLQEGEGIVWNLSPTGWRLSGTLPLTLGDVCSLTLLLPTNTQVSAGIVRWVRGEEFGLETLVIDGKAEARLGRYIRERLTAV